MNSGKEGKVCVSPVLLLASLYLYLYTYTDVAIDI